MRMQIGIRVFAGHSENDHVRVDLSTVVLFSEEQQLSETFHYISETFHYISEELECQT